MGYFGIPFRNGVPIGLASVAGFGAVAQEFSPGDLFTGGIAGTWYDPSDLTTMFTTSAGTTPVAMPGLGAAVSVGRMLDKSGNGNHAIAINDSTARPELRARVNLLTYSEQFDNAVWTKVSTTVVADAGAAPDATTTADRVYPSSTGSSRFVWVAGGISVAASAHTLSFYAKAAGKTWVYVNAFDAVTTVAVTAFFDLQNGVVGSLGTYFNSSSITAIGNGWYRCTVTRNVLPTTTYPIIGISDSNATLTATANGTDGVFLWGADLRPANIGANVPAYQRIADANTYDTAGFPLYLRFDGIDDGMYTPANLNLSATDKVGVFAGVRKLVTSGTSIIVENSSNPNTNAGTFYFVCNSGSFSWYSRGSALPFKEPTAPATTPITKIITGIGDISGDISIIRDNGVQVDSSASDQGTGNYGTYPLYIGSRNNSSLWLQGQVYGLVVVGSAISAGNISATESWMAQKTGIVI